MHSVAIRLYKCTVKRREERCRWNEYPHSRAPGAKARGNSVTFVLTVFATPLWAFRSHTMPRVQIVGLGNHKKNLGRQPGDKAHLLGRWPQRATSVRSECPAQSCAVD